MLKKFVLSAAILLALPILLEVGARVWVVHLADEDAFVRFASLSQVESRAQQERALTPHRYLAYVGTPDYQQGPDLHDALGFRGEGFEVPKPDGQFRIFCLGGSTTYSTGVEDHRLSYPSRLQDLLGEQGYGNVRVVNAGLQGWGSLESLINFQLRVLDYEPDMVILYHGVNEVHPRLVWPPEDYRGDNSGYLQPLDPIFQAGLLEHSTFARILLVASGRIAPHASVHRSFKGYAPSYHGDAFYRQRARGVYPRLIFERVDAMQMLAANPPRYLERNVRNLIASARAHDCQVVLSTFAWSSSFDEPRSSSPEYVAAYRETNDLIREIGRRDGVPVLDLAASFPDDRALYLDGRHLTAAGNDLKARRVAEFLVERGLLPPP